MFSASTIVSAQVSQRNELRREHSFPIQFGPKITLLFFGLGMVSTTNHTANMNISFPYETMDVNGVRTSHVFTGNSDRLLSGQSPQLSFGLDISKPFYVINFTTGFNTTYQGAYYSVGYGRNIYLGHQSQKLRERIANCTWILRPSLHITAFSFSGGNLGNIDNTNTTIYLLGKEAGPTYSTSYGIVKHVYHSDRLAINYKQNQIGIQPKIVFCTNPYKTKMSVQLFVSYFIPLFQSGGLQLIQHSYSDSSHFISKSTDTKIKKHEEITATYDNQPFHSIPFRANNIFIGIAFGVTIF
ncbi:MAG: hypothetical protein ACTHJT_16680 [Cytophaga sp.]|uniref:hypothetical protein n=1 Tax=Cytophaga sp. TaxID=29535 RepID=UPI003F7F4983